MLADVGGGDLLQRFGNQIAALLTSASMRPKRTWALAIMRRVACSSRKSAATRSPRVPPTASSETAWAVGRRLMGMQRQPIAMRGQLASDDVAQPPAGAGDNGHGVFAFVRIAGVGSWFVAMEIGDHGPRSLPASQHS